MTQRSLASSAIECARLFNNLSSQLLDRERETRTNLLQPSIEDEGARYKIWAGNLGAFQRLPATSSLDYRLMESPRVATQIQELLEDLRHALQKISAIASGESPNRVAELTDSEDDSEDDHDEDELKKDSDGSEDGVEANVDKIPHQISEAGELFRSTKDTITGLFRLSIIIRKASPRDRFAKALAAQQEPFDDRFDIDHVSHKFPMLNIKEKEWLKERVGKAITQRRQYLRYARDHRDKLAREPKDLWQPKDIGPRTTPLPALSQASKTYLTRPTSTLAPTVASTLLPERIAIEEEDSQDNQSRTSYAVSLGEDDDKSHLRLPSLAEVSKDATTFECPLCWTVQDIQRDSIWRKHVFGDLRPYICTFEECDIKLFSGQREWFEHELSHHRAQWCCDFCGKDDFRSLKVFKDHVRSRHMQSMKNHQLDALSEASRRSIDHIPASDCPFCQEWEVKLRLANPNISADEIVAVTPIQFRHHVGAHMQQLALFSVPRDFLEGDADTKSVTSLGNTLSDIAGLRKAQMTLEFGSPEDALKELQKLHDQTPNDLEVHLLLSKCYHEIGNESAALIHSGRAQDLRALAQKEDRSDEQVVEMLLKGDGKVDALGREYSSALQVASAQGHKQIVQMLLDKGADVNAQGGEYSSALQAASAQGHEQIVRILLEKGADVNAQGGYYGRTLQAASAHGHEQVVKMLLDRGADVNAQGGEYSSALQVASAQGHEQIVKILLNKGADVNAWGGYYGSALQAASAQGYEQIVRILLEKGADVNAQGGYYGSTLQAASAHGHEQVVKMLLEKGADVNAQGGYYSNALQAASAQGHEQIVKILLDRGAYQPKGDEIVEEFK
jgi:ankyrin repeat protein